MKKQAIQELKNKPLAELQAIIKEDKTKLHVMLLDLAAGKVKNVGSVREAKKKIARLSTFIRAAEIES